MYTAEEEKNLPAESDDYDSVHASDESDRDESDSDSGSNSSDCEVPDDEDGDGDRDGDQDARPHLDISTRWRTSAWLPCQCPCMNRTSSLRASFYPSGKRTRRSCCAVKIEFRPSGSRGRW